MKNLLALAAILSMSVGVTLVSAAGFPNRVYYINHEKVAAAMVKGGRITIPANTPHWWKDTSKTGSVGYYAVNFEQ